MNISERSFSEQETKKIFADAGIDWKTRSERYVGLKDTVFERVSGQWWIAYDEGKPVASYGIGEMDNFYLSLGAVSYKPGAGSLVTKHVIDLHGDKPIVANAASPAGKKLLDKMGFRQISMKDGFIQDTDIPTEIKSALEVASERGGTVLRKMYLLMPKNWFVLLRR